MRPGGYGILMAHNIVDELMYSEVGNEVLLIKYTDHDP
jgi:anti-sigma regulatory factor (Ser/Thr protein kinase)